MWIFYFLFWPLIEYKLSDCTLEKGEGFEKLFHINLAAALETEVWHLQIVALRAFPKTKSHHRSAYVSASHSTQNCLLASQISTDGPEQKKEKWWYRKRLWNVGARSVWQGSSCLLSKPPKPVFLRRGKCPHCWARRPWLRASPGPSQAGWDKQQDEGQLI